MRPDGRPNLLFVTPTVPSSTGHGTSMRASMLLRALAEAYDVTTLIVSIYRARKFNEDLEYSRKLSSAVQFVKRPNQMDFTQLPRHFDVIYVFRLVMFEAVSPYLALECLTASRKILDLDDLESQTRTRFAALATRTGRQDVALRQTLAAKFFAALERRAFAAFPEVCVCSELDRCNLRRLCPAARIAVVPNSVELPEIEPKLNFERVLNVLFVGTMDYYPNEDAVEYFCANMLLPLRHRMWPHDVRFVIAGGRPTPAVTRLRAIRGVVVTGEVKNISPYYGLADLVVVPIRAGGGTRVKILEAFSWKRAVVSTSIGCEGLEVRSGEQLLICDQPAAFVEACVSLLKSPERRLGLAERAHKWVADHHSFASLRKSISNLLTGEPYSYRAG